MNRFVDDTHATAAKFADQAKVADRLVDGGPGFGVSLEQSPDFACVPGAERCEKFLSRRGGQRMAPPTLDVQSVPLVTENVL